MKKYIVVNSEGYEDFDLKVGDIVTKVDDSDNDLYELPERLHGRGHSAPLSDRRSKIKGCNYLYIYVDDIKEIKEDVK